MLFSHTSVPITGHFCFPRRVPDPTPHPRSHTTPPTQPLPPPAGRDGRSPARPCPKLVSALQLLPRALACWKQARKPNWGKNGDKSLKGWSVAASSTKERSSASPGLGRAAAILAATPGRVWPVTRVQRLDVSKNTPLRETSTHVAYKIHTTPNFIFF